MILTGASIAIPRVILNAASYASAGKDLGQLRASEAGTGSSSGGATPMNELWLLHDAIAALIVLATTAAFPPIGTGAFWTIVAFYGVVTILFDDETPRGVPGMDYFYATRPHLKDPQS